MRHICAWCEREIAPPDGSSDDDLISHGISEECKRGVLAEMEGMEGMNIEH